MYIGKLMKIVVWLLRHWVIYVIVVNVEAMLLKFAPVRCPKAEHNIEMLDIAKLTNILKSLRV